MCVREELMRNSLNRVDGHIRPGSLSDSKTVNMPGEN